MAEKYNVLHSYLTTPARTFKRGEFVAERELKDAGLDLDFLIANNAVALLPGTGEEYDPESILLPVHPAMGTDTAYPDGTPVEEDAPPITGAILKPDGGTEAKKR